jgi:hypothetical protein
MGFMATKRDIAANLMRALLLPAIALAFAVVQPSSSYASILQMDIAADSGDLLSSFDERSTSGADSDDVRAPARPFDHLPQPADGGVEYTLNLETPGTTGTSSSSSSQAPGSSGGTATCLLCQAFSLDENPIIVRLALDQSFLLPAPPGVDLFRPPQLS